ncbi:MAG: cation transporter [Dysgonamonadaceae bacterium]|jgi:Cu(I)/Ag(I) efflux system membrane fusion protein|nr:cation transporter [Dysgonamonadaceae bacterium]
MKKLFFFMGVAIIMTATNACSNTGSAKNGQTVSTETNLVETKATLTVQGSCEMCKTRIEKAAKSVDGVASATWDAESKQLEFLYDASKTAPEAVSKAIATVGHDTEKDTASDDVYNALPGCCKYRS